VVVAVPLAVVEELEADLEEAQAVVVVDEVEVSVDEEVLVSFWSTQSRLWNCLL
jgi:hypothetical protein